MAQMGLIISAVQHTHTATCELKDSVASGRIWTSRDLGPVTSSLDGNMFCVDSSPKTWDRNFVLLPMTPEQLPTGGQGVSWPGHQAGIAICRVNNTMNDECAKDS